MRSSLTEARDSPSGLNARSLDEAGMAVEPPELTPGLEVPQDDGAEPPPGGESLPVRADVQGIHGPIGLGILERTSPGAPRISMSPRPGWRVARPGRRPSRSRFRCPARPAPRSCATVLVEESDAARIQMDHPPLRP